MSTALARWGRLVTPGPRSEPESDWGDQIVRLRADGGRSDFQRPSGYVLLLALVAVLVVIGLVMVLSSSSVHALRTYGSSWVFFVRQVLWVILGGVALFVGAGLDYRIWRRLATPLLVLSAVLLVLVLIPGVGISVNGSARWLGIGSWRVQPSELTKLATVVFVAGLLSQRADEVANPLRTTRPVLIVVLAVLGLVMLQPDMGTTLVLAAIAFGLLFVAGTPLSRLAGLFCVAAAAAFVVGMAAPYRRARLLAFLDPWADPGNTGYQSIQALVGMGSGGLSGVGLGASRSKWGFLPNAHTDFIFAIVGEEIGLLGSLLLVVLFVAFAVLGVRAALRAPDRFGAHLAAGITIWVVGQAFLNVGTVIGLLPVTGVPLPFVSFGGSSIVVLMLAVGILANVVRQGRPFPRRATSPPPDLPLGRPGRAASRRHPEGRPSAALDGRRKEDRPRSHPSLGPLPDPANRAGRAHPAHRAGKAGWPPKTRGRR